MISWYSRSSLGTRIAKLSFRFNLSTVSFRDEAAKKFASWLLVSYYYSHIVFSSPTASLFPDNEKRSSLLRYSLITLGNEFVHLHKQHQHSGTHKWSAYNSTFLSIYHGRYLNILNELHPSIPLQNRTKPTPARNSTDASWCGKAHNG